MTVPTHDPMVPKAFISYSWDDDAHKEWVRQLATRLRADGVDVTLDRWDCALGDRSRRSWNALSVSVRTTS